MLINRTLTSGHTNHRTSKNPFLFLMGRVRNSAKSAKDKGSIFGRPEALEIDIDEDYLEELYYEYGGCCPYYLAVGLHKKINLEYTWDTYNFLAPSIDRIDSTKGYIRGNVVITHRGTNLKKNGIHKDNFLEQLREFTK